MFYTAVLIPDDESGDYVAHCVELGVASQGETVEESLDMLKEAVELYLEEKPEGLELGHEEQTPIVMSTIKVEPVHA